MKYSKRSDARPVCMQLFYKDKFLGEIYIHKGSSHTDRWCQAVMHDMTPFDKFILDHGRVEASMVEEKDYTPKSGFTSETKRVKEFWNVKNENIKSEK